MTLAQSKRASELQNDINQWEENRLFRSGVVRLREVKKLLILKPDLKFAAWYLRLLMSLADCPKTFLLSTQLYSSFTLTCRFAALCMDCKVPYLAVAVIQLGAITTHNGKDFARGSWSTCFRMTTSSFKAKAFQRISGGSLCKQAQECLAAVKEWYNILQAILLRQKILDYIRGHKEWLSHSTIDCTSSKAAQSGPLWVRALEAEFDSGTALKSPWPTSRQPGTIF